MDGWISYFWWILPGKFCVNHCFRRRNGTDVYIPPYLFSFKNNSQYFPHCFWQRFGIDTWRKATQFQPITAPRTHVTNYVRHVGSLRLLRLWLSSWWHVKVIGRVVVGGIRLYLLAALTLVTVCTPAKTTGDSPVFLCKGFPRVMAAHVRGILRVFRHVSPLPAVRSPQGQPALGVSGRTTLARTMVVGTIMHDDTGVFLSERGPSVVGLEAIHIFFSRSGASNSNSQRAKLQIYRKFSVSACFRWTYIMLNLFLLK